MSTQRHAPLLQSALLTVLIGGLSTVAQGAEPASYPTCRTWREIVDGEHPNRELIRVSDPGTKDRPRYTGFWFFDGLQFDESGRYALAMQVAFQNRDVTPVDRGEIGYFDLENNNRWTGIGYTTAWNWQQGCRLTWRGGSNEILWNDRADEGSPFICRAYDFRTRARRTLPRPIYDVSRDGSFALTHSFSRMRHGGTNYTGLSDAYEGQIAPAETGVLKMNMNTGDVEQLVSLKRMAEVAYPDGYKGKTELYFFREGWNPSGSRFIAFLKNSDRPVDTTGWSISADGKDVRPFYKTPSHHAWIDDDTILEGHHFSIYKDDGSGRPQRVAEVDDNVNFDTTVLPGGQWFLLDTYPLKGIQYLVLYHRPSRLFVPLAKLKNTAQVGTIHRVDLHARTSRDGRTVCIDSSHEGQGRQMYILSIGDILDSPPRDRAAN